MEIASGAVLKGQYRIDALIGGGGMAIVYRAFDTNLQRVCAIKQNMDTSPEAQRQFHLEAILLASLSHPHLARVTDHFVDTSGRQYLVMDFVEGENLESYVARNGPVPEARALAWMGGVLDAVAYCHSQGVIHRDIKPANLVKRSGRDTVVLVDFGIAKQQLGGMTLAGARAATPAYAPLEQFTGHTDARSDVYALGATLYYLLTGQEPPDSRLLASGVQSLTPLRSLNTRISQQTEQAVRQAMALRVGERPQSVATLVTTLTGQWSLETKPVQPRNPRPPKRASRIALLAGALLTVVAALTLAYAYDRWSDPPSPPSQPVAAISTVTSSLAPSATLDLAAPGLTPLPDPEPSATPTAYIETRASVSSDTPILATETPTSPPSTPVADTSTPTSPPTATARPTQPTTPTPTPPTPGGAALTLAPRLVGPPDGSEQRNQVLLQWTHGGLQPGQQYRIDLRADHQQAVQEKFLLSGHTSLVIGYDAFSDFFKDDGATFFWKVVVVNTDTGNVASRPSEEWRFVMRRDLSPPPSSSPPPDTPTPEPPTSTPTPEPQTPEPPTVSPETPTPEPPTSTPTPRS